MTRRRGLSIAAVLAEIDGLPLTHGPIDPADERRHAALCGSRQYLIADLRYLRRALRCPPPRYTAHSRPSLRTYRRTIRAAIRDRARALKTARDIGPRDDR